MHLDYTRQIQLLAHPELALPNAGHATAAEDKFVRYLFNPANKDGWAKGVVFTSRLGYDASNWQPFREMLLQNATKYPVTVHRQDEHGTHYEQLTVLYGNKGKPANVLVSWSHKDGKTHLTNAYLKEVKTDGTD
ncbi:MAG: hypothetical protein GX623_06660 [Clostridiales bacterium]|nr:hypothetical protein [Clostridiales bacterium]